MKTKMLVAAMFALAAAQSAQADTVTNLQNQTVSADKTQFSAFKDMIIQNGTVNLSENLGNATAGKYTIGSGATVTCNTEVQLNNNFDINIVDGGVFRQTGNNHRFFVSMVGGSNTFTLDNGTLFTEDYSNSNGGQSLNFGVVWISNSSAKDKNIAARVVAKNGSTISIPNGGRLQIAGARTSGSYKPKTLKVDFAVTNSTINVPGNEVAVGVSNGGWITDTASSYVNAIFGPGSEINSKQIYVRPNPTPTVTLDGATIHYTGTGSNSFIGHDAALGDVYTIQSNGLTVDIPSGKALTCDGNASSLKGVGGITKIGEGSITWDKISSNGSQGMTFTGPLVVSNGTWTSTLGYAASAFRADGGTLALSGALSAANVELAATDGGTLMLAGATITDASPDVTLAGGGKTDYFTRDGVVGAYALDSLTLGPGAVLALDANATTADAINTATTNITATAANPAKIKLVLSSIPAPTETFALFEVDDADKITVEAETTAGATLEVAKTYENGVVRYAILAREYTWNDGATGANWSATDKWLLDSAPATWADNNIAVFATAGDSVAVDSDVTAVKLDFQADATVASGAGTLTVPTVSVDPGVKGTINASTAGTLEKIGTGTLTLSAARSAATTVTEGTLALTAGNDAIAVANLTLGTDPEKPVVFDYGGNTFSANLTDYLTAGMDITLTNGTFSTTEDPAWFGYTTDSGRVIPPKSLTIAKGAVLNPSARARWNASDRAGVDTTNTVNIAGGSLVYSSSATANNWIMQNSRCGTLYFNVTDGGLLQFGSEVYALTCRDSTTASDTPSLFFKIVDSTFRVGGGKSFRFGYDSSNKEPLNVTGVFAATNSTIDIGYGIYIGNDAETKTSGSYTADFDSCVVTAREIRVYKDRKQNAVRFNGTRLVVGADSGVIKTASAFETMGEGGTAVKPITIDAGGLVLDTNGKSCTLEADPQGTGAFTKTGTGTLTVNCNQTSTANFICEGGQTVLAAGLTMTRPVTVKDGATFTVEATSQATIASLALEAGATLNIDKSTVGVTPFAIGTLTLPAEGKATLKVDGSSLPAGRYAVLSKTGIVAGDFANLEVSVSGGISATYSVENETLYVDVRGDGDYVWTGLGDGESFSVGANWLGGVPPTGANLFIGVASASTLVCDIADFAPQSITFSEGSAAVTIGGAQAMSGVAAVTNLSTTVSHTINVPVYFAGNIQVKQAAMAETGDLTKAHVTFAGGAHAAQGYAIENGSTSGGYSRCMFGDYYLYPAAGSPWTALTQGSSNRHCLGDNSSLHVPYAGALHELYIGNGSVVTAGVLSVTADTSLGQRICYKNLGEIVITSDFTASGSGGKKDGYAGYSAGTGASNVFKIEKATCTRTDGYTFYFAEGNGASDGTYYFGKGGINFGSGKGYFGIGKNSDGDAQTIRPWYGDFTIGTGAGNTDGYDMYMFRDVTFNTDDENGVGRTITVDARLRFDATPTFTVSGSGKVLVNGVAYNKVQPPVTVTGTATLAFASGASLTTSNITVNAGATLAVAESGTVTLGGNLTLRGATPRLAFNFTNRAQAPVLDFANKTVTFDDGCVIKVAVGGEWPKNCEQVLTSGYDFADKEVELADGAPKWVDKVEVKNGNIVLTARQKGVTFILR